MALKVRGLDDDAGIATVKAKLKEVVGWRTAVEKTRKEMKEEYIEAGRQVDAQAKALQELIAPIESHLAGQKKIVDDELERIAREKAEQIYQLRLKRLKAIGAEKDFSETQIRDMKEEVFEVAIEQATERARQRAEAEARREAEEAERKRLADEEAERNRVERERLNAERAELDRQRAEQDAARKSQQEAEDKRRADEQAERDRLQAIEDEKRAAERAELDRQKAELQAEKDRLAKEQAEREAEAKAKADAEAETARQAAAAKRAEELKPVRHLLMELASKVKLTMHFDFGMDLNTEIGEILNDAGDRIVALAEALA